MTDFNTPISPALARRRQPRNDATRREKSAPWSNVSDNRTAGWIYSFIAVEIVCQLLLLLPQLTTFRIALRIAGFALSLAYLVILPRRAGSKLHPAIGCIVASMTLVALSFFNPEAGSLLASLATLAEYVAIAAPLFWTSGLRISMDDLYRIVFLMWSFAAISAGVGALQTLRPDWTFLQPNLSSVIANFEDRGEGLKITLAGGGVVYRPMGLTDQPGGAATAGLTTVVFGLALLVRNKSPWLWFLVISSMILGLFCIYVSLVRSMLIMTAISVIAMVFCFAINREYNRIAKPVFALALAAFFGTILALIVGGETVVDRLSSLVEDDPGAVYYQNRGHFFEDTIFRTIPKYPLGAGTGRWGMMAYYFGQSDPREPLWAEIMWTAWVYDGGVPLMLTYAAAIAFAIWQSWTFSRYRASADARIWASVVFAYNVGALAVTFNYPFFLSQGGMDFWLLNAVMFAAITEHASQQQSADKPRNLSTGVPTVPSRPLPTSLLGMNG